MRASLGTLSIVGSLAGLTARVVAVAIVACAAASAARAQDCQWPTWAQVASNPELARFEHAMAYDAARDRVVMFGGRPSQNQVLGDTVLWDGAGWSRLKAPGPAARAGHAMVFDPVRARVVLAGGVDAAGVPLRDTWEWNGSVWARVSEQAPQVRGPVLAWDSVEQRVLAVDTGGGVWSWNGVEWTALGSATLPGTYRAIEFDRARGVLVAMSYPTYTHEWTPATGWVRASQNSHPYGSLAGHSLFYSPTKGGVMCFAGNDGGGFGLNFRAGTFILLEDDWSTWGSTTFFGVQDQRREGHATVELPGGGALTFGGRQLFSSVFGHTLSMSFGPATSEPLFFIIQPRASGNFVPGGDAVLWAVLTDASDWVGSVEDLAVRYQWRRDGVPVVDGVGASGVVISGATTNTLRFTGVRLAEAGQYDLVATHCGGTVTSSVLTVGVECRANLTTTATPGQPGYGVPDNSLSSDDFFYYLAAFAAGNVAVADITTSGATAPGQPGWLVPDGQISNDDFFAYLTLYAAGC